VDDTNGLPAYWHEVADLKKAQGTSARSILQDAYIPVNMDKTESMLNSYGALLGAVLGHDHPNVLAQFDSLEEYKEIRLHHKCLLTEELGSQLAAATLLYYYHAKHRRWFTRQWRITTTTTIVPPNYSSGFEEFAEGYNLKWLPSTKQIPVLRRLSVPVDTTPPAGSGRG